MNDPRIQQIELYAWVGEDELGGGEIGLKQGLVPAGCIPLVAIRRDRMEHERIVAQLRHQALRYQVAIRLCKFVFQEELQILDGRITRLPGL
jgi:hypothetical protein